MITTKDGFTITHSNYVVTVTKPVKDPSRFGEEVNQARALLGYFKASQAGSVWGCDGVGFDIQKRAGMVRINKSGVGTRNFRKGLEGVRGRNGVQG
jgi:hypothetical protein